MTINFDPYHKWLGIPPKEQPASLYRLLGIADLEGDPDVIENAADRQMAHVRSFQAGKHGALSQRLLNEISAAKLTLLNPRSKQQYDQQLPVTSSVEVTSQSLPTVAIVQHPRSKRKADNTASKVGIAVGLLVVVVLAGIVIYKSTESSSGSLAAQSAQSNLPPATDSSPQNDEPEPTQPYTSGPEQNVTNAPLHEQIVADDSDEESREQVEEPLPSDQSVPKSTLALAGSSPSEGPDSEENRNDDIGPTQMADADIAEEALAKPSIPSDDDQKQALEIIRSVHKSDFDSAKNPDKRVELARTLLAEGRETDNDPAAQYVLLKTAIDLAVAGGDFSTALEAWLEISDKFDVDLLAGQWVILKQAMKAKNARNFKGALQQFKDDAVQQDRFDLALNAMKALLVKALPKEAKQLEAERKNVEQLAKKYAEAKIALTTLKTDPSDVNANQKAGEYLCFFKQDWANGLPMLSRGNDAVLKKMASSDLLLPSDTAQQLAVADDWWQWGDRQSDKAIKSAAESRAAYWYSLAMPNLSGLSKSKAESRMAQVPTLLDKPTRIKQVVLWNQHNGSYNDRATNRCNVILARNGSVVWKQNDLEIPWERDRSSKRVIAVPQVDADSVRVEITAWVGGGGLAEIEVINTAGTNVARGAKVSVSAEHPSHSPCGPNVIDGITDSGNYKVGYWVLPNDQAGWAELRLPDSQSPEKPGRQAAVPDRPGVRATSRQQEPQRGIIDALKAVDPVRDAVKGQWEKNAAKEIAGKDSPRIVLPVKVEGSYEFEVQFTRLGGDAVSVVFPVGDSRCQMWLDFDGWGGLSTKENVDPRYNVTKTSARVVSDIRNTFVVQVARKKDGEAAITAVVNGKKWFEWQGKENELIVSSAWNWPKDMTFGLGAHGDVVFHKALVRPKAEKHIADK